MSIYNNMKKQKNKSNKTKTRARKASKQLSQKGWQLENFQTDKNNVFIYLVSLTKKSTINHMQIVGTDIEKIESMPEETKREPIEFSVYQLESELQDIIDHKTIDTTRLAYHLQSYISKTQIYEMMKIRYQAFDMGEFTGSFIVFRAFDNNNGHFVLRPHYAKETDPITPPEVAQYINQCIHIDNYDYDHPGRYHEIKIKTDNYLKSISKKQ